LGAGALSDPRVVSASAKVIPILVDCTRQGAHDALMNTYQVRGFPTLLFVGPGGEALGKPSRRDADTLIQLMDQLGQQGGGSGSKGPALVVLIAILVAVPCILILVYKKWFAGRVEES
jgi:hypothetical protein